MIRLDQVGSTGAVDRKRVGRRRQTGLEIGEPTDSLSTLSAWYYEANVRSNVPPEREREIEGKRERESADPFLPLAFDQQVPPPFPPPYLSNTQHRETSSNFVFAAILPFDMCSLGVKGGGCPRFVFHFPHLARLINFTRTRVLIMTCAHTRSTRHDQLESLNEFLRPRINRTSQWCFPFLFFSFFSLRRWYRCSFQTIGK